MRPGLAAAVMIGGAVLASPPSADPLEGIVSAEGLDGFVTVDRLPVPEAAYLAQGREIWSGTCENCHGGERLSGAPKVTSTNKWAARTAKGIDVLASNAINGWFGPTYKEMPARGGNRDLTDAEVTQAVAFMVWASGGAETVAAWLDARDGG